MGARPLPVRIRHQGHTVPAWLTFDHGVEGSATGARCYRAGALLVDDRDPRRVLARTAFPLFGPQGVEECRGVVNNVVFVEAAQVRDGGLDVYYGMADSRVVVLHLTPVLTAEVPWAVAWTSISRVLLLHLHRSRVATVTHVRGHKRSRGAHRTRNHAQTCPLRGSTVAHSVMTTGSCARGHVLSSICHRRITDPSSRLSRMKMCGRPERSGRRFKEQTETDR